MTEYSNDAVRQKLHSLAEEDYREFHGKLLPGTENILGVRLPKLRALAKEIRKSDWEAWLAGADERTYEETMLQGLVIGYARMELPRRLELIRGFVPKINNWAVCDCFCNTLKEAEKYPEEYWELIAQYSVSKEEYEARFAAVMLLSHYVKEEYLERSLKVLESIRQEEYYAKMAVAWALSVYFAAFPQYMLKYLETSSYDDFTYKKTLQKILESYRVERSMKDIIRSMRK